MKRLLILFSMLFTFTALFSAQKEIKLNRSHSWTRLAFSGKSATKGIGFLAMAGSRYNLSLSKNLNEKEIDDKNTEAWLQELWVGPTFTKKIATNLTFKSLLLYRPQLYYLDEVGGDPFTRHTFSLHNNIVYKYGKIRLRYRLTLWDLMSVEDADGKSYENEIILRNLIGISIPIIPKINGVIEEEIFLKTTASENDNDGTEFFNRNVIWAGLDYKVTNNFKVELRYAWMYINSTSNDSLQIQVNDHYALVTFFYNFNISGD